MIAWTETAEGWRLEIGRTDGGGPSLPRLELHRGKETWVVCVLGSGSGRARTGRAWSLEEAQRAALVEARAFLDEEHQPLLAELLSEHGRRHREADVDGTVPGVPGP
jgi:hypothetical protein